MDHAIIKLADQVHQRIIAHVISEGLRTTIVAFAAVQARGRVAGVDPATMLALALDPSQILLRQGLTPDPWQRDLLLSPHRQILLNCSRQAGKSTTTAALAVHTALFQPKSLTLILSPTQRQSLELFRKIADAYKAVGSPFRLEQDSQTKMELANGSRVVCLPGREESIRSFSSVALLIIDEAARVPDDLYRSVRPMLAVSQGRLVCLSTPFGKRGFFFNEWTDDEADWHRVQITWRECPRITADFIAAEKRSMGDSWVSQEYECSFQALEGLVYPNFKEQAGTPFDPPANGRWYGGIDFGYRNPFAAVWGWLEDATDCLWIVGERYQRECPIHEHAKHLPKQVRWFADPAAPQEIAALRAAGFAVQKGYNDIRAGIAAVQARLQTGRLKVCTINCPNTIAESGLYRYPTEGHGRLAGEVPIDQDNHAMAALRYLISRVDGKFLAKFRKKSGQPPLEENGPDPEETAEAVFGAKVRPAKKPWLRLDNEALWSPCN